MPVKARLFISKELPPHLAERLSSEGVEFLATPLIKTVPLEFKPEEVTAFSPDIAVFSSKNGVKHFFTRVDPRELEGVTVVAVGSATAKALEELGFSPLVPENFSGEGVVELLKELSVKGKKVLIVRPKKARSVVQDFLEAQGAELLEAVVYETLPRREVKEELERFFEKKVDYAAFTSPSNFKAFLSVTGREELLKGVKLLPIGHVTQKAIEKAGFKPLEPPREYTVEGIVNRLLKQLHR
ncbi:Uroporphyrinogen III synthase HEM4 [Thermovibrio ammonificans HB-1]|uniref:Uroporphyrinogen-III synthase n=1 Tax=Thermovibrio ammonificans (strain DSM 15698 / JCM 12110 / HB-1) TaxID=648996 RepID=E8T5K2_THEA1|nr:uroporphyrinogen-III synthase [Thermovibrio ammonificans]ADU96477.1 Uroporphyrinogen III synthase HEM4 [Thermovibrio ammonificans HB-1]